MMDIQTKTKDALTVDDDEEQSPEEFLKAGDQLEPIEPTHRSLVQHGPPVLTSPTLIPAPYPGITGIESHQTKPRWKPKVRAAAPTVEQIVRLVVSQLQNEVGGNVHDRELYRIVNSFVWKARNRINLTQSEHGEMPSPQATATVFQRELINIAREYFREVYTDPGSRLAIGDVYGGPITNAFGIGEPQLTTSNVPPVPLYGDTPPYGMCLMPTTPGSTSSSGGGDANVESYNELSIAHTRINVCSYNRSNQSDLPNVMSIPISLGTGLAMTEYSFSRIYCVALLEVSTNFSPTFTEMGEGSPFYIGVDELSPMFNRQSDGSNQKGLFKCAAIPDPDSSKITIRVLTHKVNYMKPISIPGRLTFRFYDEQKLPLRFEQDLYRFDVGSIFIDNPNQQIVFTLPPHEIGRAHV